MTKDFEVKLRAFYSSGDESRFFEALDSIPAIVKFSGRLEFLILTVDINKLNNESMRELIGLLHRYQINLSPLRELSSFEGFNWLENSSSFWYQSMFSFEA